MHKAKKNCWNLKMFAAWKSLLLIFFRRPTMNILFGGKKQPFFSRSFPTRNRFSDNMKNKGAWPYKG